MAGVGHFGRIHALKAAASRRARLVGVYDLDAERARAVGWEAGVPPMDFEGLKPEKPSALNALSGTGCT